MGCKITPKVCKVCGADFMGGSRAKYCPDCRRNIAKQWRRDFDKRCRDGAARKIGSTDYCQQCGGEYTVASGVQQFCPACAKARFVERNSHSTEWYHSWKENVFPNLPEEEQEAYRNSYRKRNNATYARRMAVPGAREARNAKRREEIRKQIGADGIRTYRYAGYSFRRTLKTHETSGRPLYEIDGLKASGEQPLLTSVKACQNYIRKMKGDD